MNNPYQAAWAYLQGCIETLCPLITDLAPARVRERLLDASRHGRILTGSAVHQQADEGMGGIEPGTAPFMPGVTSNASGGVYFPHDLQHSGEGTFTAPGATEEEIEALMKQRYPDGEREE